MLQQSVVQSVHRTGLLKAEEAEEKARQESERELALIQDVLQGDQRAFQALYRRHSPAILRRLHRLINDPGLAEDALQQVFLEAHRSLGNFRADGNLSSWLHRIAERVAMRVYRRQWKARTLKEKLGFFDSTPLPTPEADQEESYWKAEVQQWMRLFLERLSPDHRVVLLLCDMEGMSIDEITETLGVPRGTVASRIHHARKKVRAMVERELQRQGLSWGDIIDD